jgi:hypothetical protein
MITRRLINSSIKSHQSKSFSLGLSTFKAVQTASHTQVADVYYKKRNTFIHLPIPPTYEL